MHSQILWHIWSVRKLSLNRGVSLNKQYMKIHLGYQKLLVFLQSHSYNWDSNSAKGDFFRDFDLSFMMPESTAFNVLNWLFRKFMTVSLEISYYFMILALSNPGFLESSIILIFFFRTQSFSLRSFWGFRWSHVLFKL